MAKAADELLLLVVSKPAAWHGYGLPQHLSATVEQLTQRVPTTLVSLGDPHILDAYPAATRKICAFSDVPASQHALVRFLSEENLKDIRSHPGELAPLVLTIWYLT